MRRVQSRISVGWYFPESKLGRIGIGAGAEASFQDFDNHNRTQRDYDKIWKVVAKYRRYGFYGIHGPTTPV